MRKPSLDRVLALSVLGASVGCGASPVNEPKTPTAVFIVPADRVVEKCPCDGDDEAPPLRKPVEYVHVDQWQSPPAAKKAEAFIAENPSLFATPGDPPAKLTMHQGIPETRIIRLGRWRY